jgi:hypothetical protein
MRFLLGCTVDLPLKGLFPRLRSTEPDIGWIVWLNLDARYPRYNLLLAILLVLNHGAGTAAILFVNYPTKAWMVDMWW